MFGALMLEANAVLAAANDSDGDCVLEGGIESG